jgi:beta-glucosidase
MTHQHFARARDLVAKLTLEEKASLLSGEDVWTTRPIERLDIPSIWMADGPHGVRKAHRGTDIGAGGAVPATNFPALSALACSWDVALVRRLGAAMGREARAQGVDVLLGPGVNIQRSPLGGRNFEYFSEDPLLAGELGAAFVQGVQGAGVGASLKHYAANDQETGRMYVSAEIDARTLREIHLRPFEIVVTKSQPWTVMCSYNRVNGAGGAENPFLLHDVLKTEWGAEGIVVSDWGAVNDRVEGVRAGLHLEMPGSGGVTDREVVAAVRAGRLDEARLDEIVVETLVLVLRAEEARGAAGAVSFDEAEHHALGRAAAAECIVLARNEGDFLPLDPATHRRVAVIGRFATQPRTQGGGSSQVTPTRTEPAWDALRALAGDAQTLVFAPGTDERHDADAAALAEACRAAGEADAAVVFVGLPPSFENEGADRTHMDLPPAHDALVEAVASVQPNLAVVVVCGAPVRLPWVEKTRALVLAGLGGQAAGGAIADVLTGRVNPSGRLAVTWPRRLEDTPAFLHFPGDGETVRYGEGIFVGYRHHDTADVAPRFAFGHGLSYTRFEYRGIETSAPRFADRDGLEVRVRVANTGARAGSEVVQLYLRDVASRVRRPAKELAAFEKVALGPGEETTVRFALDRRAFAFWDARMNAWATESGEFEVLAGASSRDVRLRATVTLEAVDPVHAPFDRDTPLRRWLEDERARAAALPALGQVAKALGLSAAAGAAFGPDAAGSPGGGGGAPPSASMVSYLMDLPIGKLVGLSRGAFTREALDALLAAANAPRG